MTDLAPAIKLEEHSVAEVLDGIGAYTVCFNDPPWTMLSSKVRPPYSSVPSREMEYSHLEVVAAHIDLAETIVGVGGGTALDTAKFLAWKYDKRLVQIPTIVSVDAGFTESVGVRVDGKVRYIGTIMPDLVVLDVPLVRSAPKRLNRAGVGDVLSCHTGLHDWRASVAARREPRWSADLASFGEMLIVELEAALDDVREVTADGVRFLANAYCRIGAACSAAKHSRFEEGSEHFLAYIYEHNTGAHHIHGELISFGVVVMSAIQNNFPARAINIVLRSGVRAHPDDLGITKQQFATALFGLREYARNENLDVSVVDLRDMTDVDIECGWVAANSVSRNSDDRG